MNNSNPNHPRRPGSGQPRGSPLSGAKNFPSGSFPGNSFPGGGLPGGRAVRRSAGITDPTDAMVNHIIDLECDGQVEEAGAVLHEAAKYDPIAAERYDQTKRVLGLLKSTANGPSPDLTQRIIESVEAQRVFLPRPTHRRLGAGRPLVASAAFAALAIAALMKFRSPEPALDAVAQPQMEVVDAASHAGVESVVANTGEGITRVASSARDIGALFTPNVNKLSLSASLGSQPAIRGGALAGASRYENLSFKASPIFGATKAGVAAGVGTRSFWCAQPLTFTPLTEPETELSMLHRPHSLLGDHELSFNSSLVRTPFDSISGEERDRASLPWFLDMRKRP
jgi:hypothetical protein